MKKNKRVKNLLAELNSAYLNNNVNAIIPIAEEILQIEVQLLEPY
jgi:PhoPQ-activated pathogenicity-related protein